MSIYDTSAAAANRLINTFKNPVTLSHERYTKSSDGQGGNSTSWSVLASGLEAAVIPLSGKEQEEAMRLNFKATHAVYMRYSDASDIQSQDRLVFDGRILAVVDPRNIGEANAAMRILVEENTGD